MVLVTHLVNDASAKIKSIVPEKMRTFVVFTYFYDAHIQHVVFNTIYNTRNLDFIGLHSLDYQSSERFRGDLSRFWG